jgi:hypothetical protein
VQQRSTLLPDPDDSGVSDVGEKVSPPRARFGEDSA